MSALPAQETYSAESYAASLFERHKAAVYRHCLKQLRRREDADDAMQTTFVYALLSLRRGVVPQTELAWLYTIASNVCSSNRRAWARRGALATAQDVDALHDVIPMPDHNVPVTADEFRTALTSMPDTQRRALLLREWRGLSYSEIADNLGLTQSATETLLFRARRTLAGKLQERAGAGFSIATFLRSLLQSGAAKTVAAGLGATAIAITPSAEPRTARVPDLPRTAVGSQRVLTSNTPRPRTSAPVTQLGKPGRKTPAATAPAAHVEDGESAVQTPEITPPASPEPPSTPPTATPPPAPQQPTGVKPQPEPTAPPGEEPLPVPDVTVPPLPAVDELLPPLPAVELPAVSVPPLPLPLPTSSG